MVIIYIKGASDDYKENKALKIENEKAEALVQFKYSENNLTTDVGLLTQPP